MSYLTYAAAKLLIYFVLAFIHGFIRGPNQPEE